MRIAKYISNAGYCSRREAEKLIDQKKVYINNICCNHPSTLVNEKDKIVKQLDNLLKINKKAYGSAFIEIDELMENWEFQEDVTDTFDLHKFVNNKDLLTEKPDYYHYLVNFIEEFNSQNLQK